MKLQAQMHQLQRSVDGCTTCDNDHKPCYFGSTTLPSRLIDITEIQKAGKLGVKLVQTTPGQLGSSNVDVTVAVEIDVEVVVTAVVDDSSRHLHDPGSW
jgi:hypothetical protein